MIWILLPVFNEEGSLPRLLPKIENSIKNIGFEYRIVVVNDGSRDKTSLVLQGYTNILPLDIIDHVINRGLGETERDGFEYIASRCDNDDIVIRMDCDDTHEPRYFLYLIEQIMNGYDVVIASRFKPGGGQKGVNVYRALVSYFANLFMKMVFGVKGVREYSCGYRAYRGHAIKYAVKIFGNGFIQLKGLGFTSTLETVIKLNLLGCKFTEIPFVLRYDQKVGNSKMVSSVTTIGYLVMALLYHWPFGGWKIFYRNLSKTYNESKEEAIRKYAYCNKKKTAACRIGGG
ncbi:MAG: glycosyltransferase family 2 protein [Candidatus Omnitrophota bacterium]